MSCLRFSTDQLIHARHRNFPTPFAPRGEGLGIPLPAATQREIVEEAAQGIKPSRDELIRQAAQDAVVHNDDTGMRVPILKRDPSDERPGTITSGIVSFGEGHKIALYFTGRLLLGPSS